MSGAKLDTYLAEKIAGHVAAILDQYLGNPDDVNIATSEVMDAIEHEIVWACTDDPESILRKRQRA